MPNRALAIRSLVGDLESHNQFRQLVKETEFVFRKGKQESGWAKNTTREVQTFLRRVGCYIDMFEGREIKVDAAFQDYYSAFKKQEHSVTYLAPLELVEFEQECINFEGFEIRRFSTQELNRILGNESNDIFYPWAVIDVEMLAYYWFLHVPNTELERRERSTIYESAYVIHPVKPQWTAYPKSIELALQLLILLDWTPRGDNYPEELRDFQKGWRGFTIPFVLTVYDDLLSTPARAYDLSGLDIYIDKVEGLVHRPVESDFDKNETQQLQDSLNHLQEHVRSLRERMENEWTFLDIALGYFVKAYFTEGLEQLLWHITVLETLFGERKEGVNARLARRISNILGENNRERDNLKKRFNELYDVRCELVHGKAFSKDIHKGHLRIARELARKSLIWFIGYLSFVQEKFRGGQLANIPNRDDLLTVLDIPEDIRLRLSGLMTSLPKGFPTDREWLK